MRIQKCERNLSIYIGVFRLYLYINHNLTYDFTDKYVDKFPLFIFYTLKAIGTDYISYI